MSAVLDPAIEQLLSTLESTWLDPLTATNEDIDAWLGRRQEILSQLQTVDGTRLDAASREAFKTRMGNVITRDQDLMRALRARMQIVAEQLGKATRGRAAVRGYRAAEAQDAKILIRPA